MCLAGSDYLITSECSLTQTSKLRAVSSQLHLPLLITCDGCVLLSFNLKIQFHLAFLPHDDEVESPFGVRVKFLYEFSTLYFICSAERETDSKFRSFIESVDRRFLDFQNHG